MIQALSRHLTWPHTSDCPDPTAAAPGLTVRSQHCEEVAACHVPTTAFTLLATVPLSRSSLPGPTHKPVTLALPPGLCTHCHLTVPAPEMPSTLPAPLSLANVALSVSSHRSRPGTPAPNSETSTFPKVLQPGREGPGGALHRAPGKGRALGGCMQDSTPDSPAGRGWCRPRTLGKPAL